MKNSDAEPIIPPSMAVIVERAGYLPAVKANGLLFCAGQVGRNSDLTIIADPEAQFRACWQNLQAVLREAGCAPGAAAKRLRTEIAM